MYAVIFRASIAQLDQEYAETASRMRMLAMEQYGCVDFVSYTSGNDEVSISYWLDEDAIVRWKSAPEHVRAQRLGQEKWYKSYRIEVVEIQRSYSFGTDA